MMIYAAIFYAFGNLGFLQEDPTGGIPWWVILLLLAIVTIVVIWALTRSANFSETDAPHVEHRSEHVEVAAIEEPAYVEPAPPAAPEPPAVAFSPDNLIVIEGIGPKIAAVLNAAGIQTFAQLAGTDPEKIRKILFDSDPRLARLGDPTTWPAQAKLAADGDMAGLQALQDSLRGGRENI
jgi:predicted flap endonuclease-1-like 5' DNA nuclease